MNRKAVLINIGANGIEITRRADGQSLGRVEFDPVAPGDPEQWIQAVCQARDELKAIGGLRHRPAFVIYRNPTAATQVTSVKTHRRSQAVTAAQLTVMNAIHVDESNGVASAVHLCDESATTPPTRHVLASADQTSNVEAIVDLCESVGLNVHQIIPAESVIAAWVLNRALTHSRGVCGWLYIGRPGACFVVFSDQDLRVFRQITFGTDALVDALCRPIRLDAGRGDHTFTRARAGQLLAAHGIPDRDALLDESTGLRGWHLLPLLQPMLQRLLVELKQSFRFGLDADERSKMKLVLTGKGARIEGLGPLLAESMEVAVERDEQIDQFDPLDDFNCDDIVHLSGDSTLERCPNLVPPSAVVTGMTTRFGRSLWLGLAAALALLVFDTTRLDSLIHNAQESLDRISAQAHRRTELTDRQQVVMGVNRSWDRLHYRLSSFADASVDSAAVCREIAALTPSDIRLVELEIESDDTGSLSRDGHNRKVVATAGTVRIHAYAIGDNADQLVARYAAKLKDSALLSSVEIGVVQRSDLDGQSARRFELRTRIVPVGNQSQVLLSSVESEEEDVP